MLLTTRPLYAAAVAQDREVARSARKQHRLVFMNPDEILKGHAGAATFERQAPLHAAAGHRTQRQEQCQPPITNR